jgi:hypothetical protein
MCRLFLLVFLLLVVGGVVQADVMLTLPEVASEENDTVVFLLTSFATKGVVFNDGAEVEILNVPFTDNLSLVTYEPTNR